MINPYDKNGNMLKGATIVSRTIKEDGGLEKHDKKVAKDYICALIDEHEEISSFISQAVKKENRPKLKVIIGKD